MKKGIFKTVSIIAVVSVVCITLLIIFLKLKSPENEAKQITKIAKNVEIQSRVVEQVQEKQVSELPEKRVRPEDGVIITSDAKSEGEEEIKGIDESKTEAVTIYHHALDIENVDQKGAVKDFLALFEKHKNEYVTRYSGERFRGGPAGAEGLYGILRIAEEKLKHRYSQDVWKEVIEYSNKLVQYYGGVPMGCWEFCPSYDYQVSQILNELYREKIITLDSLESALLGCNSVNANKYMIAENLQTLGNHYCELNDYEHAEVFLSAILDKYPKYYYFDEGDGYLTRYFSLDALYKSVIVNKKLGRETETAILEEELKNEIESTVNKLKSEHFNVEYLYNKYLISKSTDS